MKTSFLETIKIFDGEVYNLDYHQKRYERVLSSFGINNFLDLATFINPPSVGLYRCKISYTLDNTFDTTYYLYEKKTIQSLKVIHANSIQYGLKYEDRSAITALFEKREFSDDILIVKDGYITDTSIANIALYDGTSWVTPKTPLLKGTTRQRYLDYAKIVESDIQVEDLKKYSKIALLNAMIDFDIITDISYT